MERSANQYTARMDHAEAGIKLIDDFFALEERTAEEDKLRYGLEYGVAHGILTQDEMDECLRAYHDSYMASSSTLADLPNTT